MNLNTKQPRQQVTRSDRLYILVIEDELLIRTMLCEALRQEGYAVIEASNADDALGILAVIVPDLIVTDVRMPGSLDGTQLLAKLRKTNSTLPVIVTSGHLQHLADRTNDHTHFLSKPYTFETLINIVRRELRG